MRLAPSLSLALVVVLCVGVAACDGKQVERGRGAAPAWRRVEWTGVGATPDLAPRNVATLSAHDVVEAVCIAPGGKRDLPIAVAGDPPRLPLRGEGPRLARLPLAIEAARIDAAALVLDVPDGEQEAVLLSFLTGPRTRAYADIMVVEGGPGLERVEFELSAVQRLEGRLDHVMVHTAGRSTCVDFSSVTFSARPALALLPAVADGPRHVHVGTDGRAGVGLAGDAPLAGSVELPPVGEFHLSYRVGPGAELADATLVIEGLDAASGELLRLPLAANSTAWREVVRPVEGARRAALSARIEGSDPTAATAVADCGVLDVERVSGAQGASASPPRTVVLITSDTHRGELLSATSPGVVATPALDALAARGVLFLDAAATTNATNPSHVALMTGVHPRDTRVVTNRAPVVRQATTLAERFAAAGWRTAAAHSTFQLGDDMSGLGQGFDRYDGPGIPTGENVDVFRGSSDSVRLGELTVARALAAIDAVGDAPLFLWVHVYDPHSPYSPPPAFDRKYYGQKRDPRRDGPGLALAAEDVPSFLAGIHDPAYPWDQYRALVDYVDHILTPLLTLPRVAAGITAFTSDHGEAFGNQGIWWDHKGIYPDTTSVPMILAYPSAPSARVAHPVEQFHLGRTLLALAGLPADGFPGKDLRDALASDPLRDPRYALAANGYSASIDDGRWLAILHLLEETSDDRAHRWRPGQLELFDRKSDPTCQSDRVADDLPRARRMHKALLTWLDAADPTGLAGSFHISAAINAALSQLGYASTEPTGNRWFDPARGDHFTETYGAR